jgi:hypothetical protein
MRTDVADDEIQRKHPSVIAISSDALDDDGHEAIVVTIDGARFLAKDFKVDHFCGEPQVTLTLRADNVLVKP